MKVHILNYFHLLWRINGSNSSNRCAGMAVIALLLCFFLFCSFVEIVGAESTSTKTSTPLIHKKPAAWLALSVEEFDRTITKFKYDFPRISDVAEDCGKQCSRRRETSESEAIKQHGESSRAYTEARNKWDAQWGNIKKTGISWLTAKTNTEELPYQLLDIRSEIRGMYKKHAELKKEVDYLQKFPPQKEGSNDILTRKKNELSRLEKTIQDREAEWRDLEKKLQESRKEYGEKKQALMEELYSGDNNLADYILLSNDPDKLKWLTDVEYAMGVSLGQLLLEAVKSGDENEAKRLISYGAGFYTDSGNYSALALADAFGLVNIGAALTANGAVINTPWGRQSWPKPEIALRVLDDQANRIRAFRNSIPSHNQFIDAKIAYLRCELNCLSRGAQRSARGR